MPNLCEEQKLAFFPLLPVFVEEPFRQWGLDFIGEIHLPSSGQHKWILTTTDYFTKRVEVVPARNVTNKMVIKFMEENILSKSSCPRKIVTDNSQVFKSTKFINFFQSCNIILGHFTNYYPRENGFAKLLNNTLAGILKKIIAQNKKDWDSKLRFSLWTNRFTTKRSIRKSHFELVYWTLALFPAPLAIPIVELTQDVEEEPNFLTRR